MPIRLCICAVWSAPVLFVYNPKVFFSWRASCFLYSFKYHVHWVIIKPKSIINRVATDDTFRWKKKFPFRTKDIFIFNVYCLLIYTIYWPFEQQSRLQQMTNLWFLCLLQISHESLAGRWFTCHDVTYLVLFLQVAKKMKMASAGKVFSSLTVNRMTSQFCHLLQFCLMLKGYHILLAIIRVFHFEAIPKF